MTAQEIKKMVQESEYEYIGIRADDYAYEIEDICNNSHQLFQDPDFDEGGELIYPAVEDTESPYYGFYDAGELNGACAIRINAEQVEKALEEIKSYYGKHIYIIAGDSAEYGNDEDEIVICDAKVLGGGGRMRRYDDCVRTDGMCGACSLSNHGRDCHNIRINSILYNRSVMGMTQKELAEKSGINIRQIQKYESGEYDTGNMTLKNALALAEALECEAKDLI